MANPVQDYLAKILGSNSADYTPSVYDVQNRQALAKSIAGNQIPAVNPLGVVADTLSGALSSYENKQAALEQQQGLTDANTQLAQALQGQDISSMVTAGGNPFLPQSETGLVGDMLKRKLGIGETFYGTPIVATDADGRPHYYQAGSMGDTREMQPDGGMNWAPKQQFLDTGTGFSPVSANAGVNLSTAGNGAGGVVPINNAQPAFDKSYGGDIAKTYAAAPEQLQKEQQLIQTLDQQHNVVSGAIDTALQQIQSNPVLTTGLIGGILNQVSGPGYDLAQTLNTIKANIGFDTLQNMRQNSPTGGALGQISNMEEELLQAVNGSLDPKQSAARLAGHLQQIKQLSNQINALKHQNYTQDVQRFSAPPAAPPTVGGIGAPANVGATPSQPSVVDYSTYFKGQ